MSAAAETVKGGFSLKEWIFTTDHKRVGVLYLIGSCAAFLVAGAMAIPHEDRACPHRPRHHG